MELGGITEMRISELFEQRTTADSLSSHTYFTYFLRGTDQGVESIHDFFYTIMFSTLYFGKNTQYLSDIYM